MNADRYFRLNLLAFAASVTLTRFILEVLDYPIIGDETFHIAHVLYGGVLLYAGSLVPLVYANGWAYTWSSVLSGVGVGLFIDEVGKFITQSNDYFFPAAAPIIYAFFLTSVLVYSRVARRGPGGAREEFYGVLESLGSVVDHDMDPDDYAELRQRLLRIGEEEAGTGLGMLSRQILGYVESEADHFERHEPGVIHKARHWFEGFEGTWLSRRNVRLFVALGLLVFGLAGSVRLLYYTSGGQESFEALLRERVEYLPVDSIVSQFWTKAQLVMEGAVGLALILSAVLFVYGNEGAGLGLGLMAMLVYLVGVDMIQFYIDQFHAVTKALIQFLFLQAMYYYQRRFPAS